MKKFLSYFAFAALTLSSIALVSCNDDETTTEQPTEEVVITESDAEGLINAIYGPLQTLSSSYSFLLESATETTVSFEGADDAGGPVVSLYETNPTTSYVNKAFNALYTSIGRANLAIEQINGEEGKNLTESVKTLLTARAKFFRGYNYFTLVQLYGEVPIKTSVDDENVERNSIDEVYEQAVKDLTEAIEGLPEYTALKYVPSQGAANAILSKLYLTWGQIPLTQSEVAAIASSKTDPEHRTDAAKLKKAIEYADKVITNGKWQLQANYNDIFGGGSVKNETPLVNENNDEVLFSIYHDGDGVDAQGNHQTHCGYTWPGQARKDPHIQYADITLENLIPEGDARREYSYATRVTYNPANFDQAAKDTLSFIDTLTWPVSVVRPGKWFHRSLDPASPYDVDKIGVQPNDIDHIDFRLGEILLVKAEAQFFTNDGDKGLAAINKLRTRAGVTPLASVTKEDLFNEWSYELSFEQKHWLNLVRWRTLISSTLDKVPNYEYYKEQYKDEESFVNVVYNGIPADPTRAEFYTRIYKHLHSKVDKIDGHFYRFPIPKTSGIDKGITLQNPGY